jgi:hypothetical protein
LKNYRIRVYNNEDKLLYDTDLLYTNDYTDVNNFNHSIPYNFEVAEGYYFILDYTTKNLYSESLRYGFDIVASQRSPLIVVIDAYEDIENGNFGIRVTKSRATGYFTGSVVIRRADNRDGFTI